MLGTEEQQYLERRRRLLRRWPWVGTGLLLLLLCLGVWLVWTRPTLANPVFVWQQLEAGSLAPDTLILLAGLAPVLLLALLGLTGIVLLLAFVAFANESRLLRMLEKHRESATRTEPSR